MNQMLQKRTPGSDTLLIGGAIGIGMTAEAAVRGGADFLLALNAGRYRVMGAASLAALLPLSNANRFTDQFARREILDRVSVPVLFGASCFDPATSPERLVELALEVGYHGIANFPSAIHFDGRFRQLLEEAGLGFAREARMLALAREAGLLTFGYAKTRSEIAQLIEAEVAMICLNFGWNAGGVQAVAQSFTIAEAADRARRIFASVRARSAATLCFVEGGPIINPDDMFRVCDEARADGYVGGSTLDRVPLETSVSERTSAFKAFGILKQTDSAQSRELGRVARIAGIVGQSEFVLAVLEQIARLAGSRIPALICGEPGLGRGALARALHPLSERSGPLLILRAADPETDPEALLFGAGPRQRAMLARLGATVVIENAEALRPEVQRRLADWLEQDALERRGNGHDPGELRLTARLVLVCNPVSGSGAALIPALARRLQAGKIEVPPLRERPEDVPALARHRLAMLGGGRQISADGYRLLLAHAWPGNIPELRAVIDRAALESEGPVIGSGPLAASIGTSQADASAEADQTPQPLSERDWLLDALRRNRFRRGDTAAFLGLSRKTLYNKMRRAGLLE
ncbi:MAG: phosphoenolpyruvate hydrolase family protein [Pararhodobacter sp.]|nr:phosphoenolpyruvate hydrolase family protein [Pararhodobacter sp.]